MKWLEPKGDVAIDFMMHASTPEAQAEQEYITGGPMRAFNLIIQAGEPGDQVV